MTHFSGGELENCMSVRCRDADGAPNNVEAQQFGPSVPRECGRVVELACGPNQTAAGEVVNDASEKG